MRFSFMSDDLTDNTSDKNISIGGEEVERLVQ